MLAFFPLVIEYYRGISLVYEMVLPTVKEFSVQALRESMALLLLETC